MNDTFFIYYIHFFLPQQNIKLMKQFITLIISMILVSACNSTKIVYPETEKEDIVDTYFDTKVSDPFRWLENDTSEATSAWVNAQNKVTYDYLSNIPFRNDLKKRLTKLTNYARFGAPFKKNGKYYFFKNNGLQNQSVLYTQTSLDATPEILLNPNTFSVDGTVALSETAFSKDGKYLSYSIARSGSDWKEIYVMDIQNKTLLKDSIKWSKSAEMAWQGNGFYYSAYPAPEAGKVFSSKNEYEKVYYHTIGQKQSDDKLIYEDQEHALRECYAFTTESEKYLFISITETTTGNGLIVKDLTKQNTNFVTLVNGFDNDYSVLGELEGKIYILTNWNAPNQRLMAIQPTAMTHEKWQEILPESENVLENVELTGNKFVALYMKDACHHAYMYDAKGKMLNEITLPGFGTITEISADKESSQLFYTFTSYIYPPTIFQYNTNTNKSNVFHASDVEFESEQYNSEQVFYTSKDGTKVPMTITYKKTMQKNGSNPLMLYGYGGFNISLKPSFSVSRIPFLENGGIYVVANLRGGGEYGESWHLAGTKMKKQNVFDDFIAAAEYLIMEKYTSSEKLAIDGGSNGGLLVGACLTQRPDLFAVAVPEVGVLDMLRYHTFTIGWSWTSDYGNSEESKEMFEYLKAYSPLHNIKKGTKYPATFVMTGDHDDRVVPAHSFKYAATLQDANDGTHPTLIRIDTNAGHGAGKPIGKLIDAQTDMWSFVMYNLGMNPFFTK